MCAVVSTPALESDVLRLQHRGRNNTEVHFRGLAPYTQSQIGSICANHVMEIHSPAPENVNGVVGSSIRTATVAVSRRLFAACLQNETRTLSIYMKVKIEEFSQS